MLTQAMAKLKDVEAAMVEHTLANKDKVGEGLVLLPGVKDLLEKLQVCCDWAAYGCKRGAADPCSAAHDRAQQLHHITCTTCGPTPPHPHLSPLEAPF
jgi:hypothetical protein